MLVRLPVEQRELRVVGKFEEYLMSPLPEWLVEMLDHYNKTRTYRSDDLYKLLGDQTKGITFPIQTTTGDTGPVDWDALMAQKSKSLYD